VKAVRGAGYEVCGVGLKAWGVGLKGTVVFIKLKEDGSDQEAN
jgi:hypothetical protein